MNETPGWSSKFTLSENEARGVGQNEAVKSPHPHPGQLAQGRVPSWGPRKVPHQSEAPPPPSLCPSGFLLGLESTSARAPSILRPPPSHPYPGLCHPFFGDYVPLGAAVAQKLARLGTVETNKPQHLIALETDPRGRAAASWHESQELATAPGHRSWG